MPSRTRTEAAIRFDENVLVVDDLLAKGSTAVASSRLVEAAGAVSACLFFIEVALLRGAERLAPRPFLACSVMEPIRA